MSCRRAWPATSLAPPAGAEEDRIARYIALIDGGPGAYGVAFPDCPGCTAMGETLDAAIRNAGESLREWVGDRIAVGEATPAARTADTIRADPAEREAVAEAVMWTSIPLLIDEGRAVRVDLSLDAGALAMIDQAAMERGLTRSAFLVSAAREKILGDG